MRKKSYKTVNLTKINIAHREACAKHPKFCDDITGAREWFIVDELDRWRKVNSVAPYHADAILNEEILEALEAYKQGDLKHCLIEKWDFYNKWHNRWLKIAEKFTDKEAK